MLKDRNLAAVEPTVIALQLLSYIAGNSEILARFMNLTGVDPSTLRGRLEEPTFQLAMLDFAMGDESLLLAFAADHGLKPEDVVRAHQRLQGETL